MSDDIPYTTDSDDHMRGQWISNETYHNVPMWSFDLEYEMHEDLINRYNFCNRLFSIGENDVDTEKNGQHSLTKWMNFKNIRIFFSDFLIIHIPKHT